MPGYSTPDNQSSYGYTPSLVMAVIFLALYAVSGIIHTVQTFTKKCPKWMVVMVVACVLEVVGWGGRIWSRYDGAGNGYIMQICCLVIAPTFMSAALYMLLGQLIAVVAPHTSPLSAKQFKIVFIVADVFSLVVQAAGGGIAATASTPSLGDIGSNLMLAGIVIQLVVMVFFVAYGLYWGAFRAGQEWRVADRNLWFLVLGMALCSLGILIRGVYRTAELAGGFNGSLAENQTLFLLDAVPITFSTFAINVFHPNRLLPPAQSFSPRHRDSAEDTFVEMNTVEAQKY
ncbi:RTA-like protein [Pseudohyphozyma bogoriensis]|nr:RTA-like protein [Pseudohyphozyma bogoriensis]